MKKDSFTKIDYSLRPAKHAERRMLCDVFRKLAAFDPVETYRYVGFGSVWFSDFTLFHRALGIKDMLSIEQAVDSQLRIEANRPFWINMDFRTSAIALPELDYDRRQFIWLDYDDTITTTMLSDAAMVASRAKSGTVLVISTQCMRAPEISEAKRELAIDPKALSASERFRQRFGPQRVSVDIEQEDLSGWSFGELSRSMFFEEIRGALETRRLADPSNAIDCKLICNFEYEDGAKMTTLAVVFFNPAEEEKMVACAFDKLEFLNPGEDTVYVPVPKLTPREFRQLESQLPLSGGRKLDMGHIPSGEATNFASMYRYFPNFIVAES